jgi:aspartate aminotransferase-like enzyme
VHRHFEDLNPPRRLLFGAGPSNPEPRVLRAMAAPPLGALDPTFTALVDEAAELCRYVFRTRSWRSFPAPGAARAGLEAVLASVVEAGDRVVVGVNGQFGELLAEIARRYGADVAPVEGEWGRVLEPDALAAALRQRPTKLVALVHADPSTGVVQPLAEIARACREHDALLLVDAALSLGGCTVDVDAWGVDACVGALQKCLGGPAGLAPLTYGERVETALAARREPPRTSFLDLTQLQDQWSPERLPHHTPAASLVYALREALRIVQTEGLERRWKRHRCVGAALAAGLEALGLRLFGDPRHRTPMLALAEVPEGVSEPRVRQRLLNDYAIEIAPGHGPLYGRVWRVGLMGYNARLESALTVLGALEAVLAAEGFGVAPHAAAQAAHAAYEDACAAV